MTKQSATLAFVVLTALGIVLQSLVAVGDESNLVRVYGDGSAVAMVEPLSESFMQIRPGTTVSLTVDNEKSALDRLASGYAEVAVVEGEANQRKIADASKKGMRLVAKEIGYMDIMIIVNRGNPVDGLTVKQIADMYTGRTRNWKDVGGDDIPIICHLPYLPYSPTVQWWKSTFLNGESVSSGTVVGHRWNAIAYRVGGPKSGKTGAIGFIRSRDLHRLAESGEAGMLKVLPIRKQARDVAELPRLGAHGQTNYPIQRPLYAYYVGNSKSRLPEEFVSFLASAAGADKDSSVGGPSASK